MENNTTKPNNIFDKYKRKLDSAEEDLQVQKRSTKITKVNVEEKIEDLLIMSKIQHNTRKKLNLSPNAPTWAKDLNDTGLKVFYSLLSQFKSSLVPTIKGNKGFHVSATAFLEDIHPFLEKCTTARCQKFISNYTPKRAPYTGKRYLHFLFQLFTIDQVKEIFSIFEDSPPTGILFLSKPLQQSNRRRIENPLQNHPELLFDVDKLIDYNMKEFGSMASDSTHLELKVGRTDEKRYSFFEIEYVLNLEDLGQVEEDTIDPSCGLVSGELSFSYHFETTTNGARRETSVKGVEAEINDEIGNHTQGKMLPAFAQSGDSPAALFVAHCKKRLEEMEFEKPITITDILL